MLTATQKIRLTLTGSPTGEPHFLHEGEKYPSPLMVPLDEVVEALCELSVFF